MPSPSSFVFTPQDFGAKADGATHDTAAIQAAVEAAHRARGTVLFPPGRYLSGTIHLRSHIQFELGYGAVLIGSLEREAYQRIPETGVPVEGQDSACWYSLLLGHGLDGVVITGRGTLNGNGSRLCEAFAHHYPPVGPQKKIDEKYRPLLINLVECRRCEVSGLTLEEGASWMQSYSRCVDLRLENLRVEGISAWNNDGLDLCDSREVVIRGCHINAADDGICLKSTHLPVEDVVISDCVVRSSASGIKCGTASSQGFRNISISNVVIFDTARSGITLQVVDGGTLEQVAVSNVTMRNVGNAIYLRLGDRSRRNAAHRNVGALRQVTISNVVAEVTGFDADAGYPFRAPRHEPRLNPLPSAIVGLPDAKIEAITLSNIRLLYRGGLHAPESILTPGNEVPESRADYPEYDQFGELPAWGFYLRHASDIVFRDVRARLEGEDVRPGLVQDDVEGFEVKGCRFEGNEVLTTA
ncbi:Pectate lyase superfamily protein [Verrucomicrobium sp. GAS474]|uniref:glycoside hydrolase family 28 protein n=1 Tax=Verrucomicrobium sp. GAS474 TaxID=1882831 RepID=UPI00087A0A58|nr:glycosyl hydrolase family 28 protein [Verrucomicrobium sp. GAS474]SDU02895.1 Pectate lyase superfamily protein [Verrucomicrobium sp. GAS474]